MVSGEIIALPKRRTSRKKRRSFGENKSNLYTSSLNRTIAGLSGSKAGLTLS
jgi:HlyD family secretion protein